MERMNDAVWLAEEPDEAMNTEENVVDNESMYDRCEVDEKKNKKRMERSRKGFCVGYITGEGAKLSTANLALQNWPY